MVVQHNLTAMNSNRMLGITQTLQAKSSEKLSSGFRINRAADDAAGLSISEKMRKQINGLDTASTNAQDGVSAVQTAEGALTEVHSMLQRMNELAVQAANGTNSASDREAIQAEIEQLETEIDRVADTTKFNETYLLKGATIAENKTKTVAAHDAGLLGELKDNKDGTSTFTLNEKLEVGDKVTIAGKEYTIGKSAGQGTVLDPDTLNTSIDGYAAFDAAAAVAGGTFDAAAIKAGDSVTFGGVTYTLTNNIGIDDHTFVADEKFKIGEVEFTVTAANTGSDPSVVTNNKADIDADDVKNYIKQALAEGKQVTITSFKPMQYTDGDTAENAANEVTDGYNVVLELADGEVSAAHLKASTVGDLVKAGLKDDENTDIALAAGDSVTISGKTTVATPATATSAKVVYDAIDALDEDGTDKVKLGTGISAKEYTIVAEDALDEDNRKITKEMLLAKIKDGETVAISDVGGAYAAAMTVIGDIGDRATPKSDVITAKTAYALMAAELEKASSIGTDKGSEAKVTNDGDGKFTIKQGEVAIKDALNFNLHVGADADMTNKITIDIEAMSAVNLGIKDISVAGDTGANATYAIDAIADAISKVSAQRSALGAIQNRLEHTIANLDNVVENTTAAESRIRDTDMAEEMVEYSKNNILAQAGQSMLAQANQSTQGVLSLLG